MVRADVARVVMNTWGGYQKFKGMEIGDRTLEEIIGVGNDKNKKLDIVKGLCGDDPRNYERTKENRREFDRIRNFFRKSPVDVNCKLLAWEVDTGRI